MKSLSSELPYPVGFIRIKTTKGNYIEMIPRNDIERSMDRFRSEIRHCGLYKLLNPFSSFGDKWCIKEEEFIDIERANEDDLNDYRDIMAFTEHIQYVTLVEKEKKRLNDCMEAFNAIREIYHKME